MSAVHRDAKSADFRRAMREFASGVAIVTCANGKERPGCTAPALASLSLSPPSLVICLERISSTLAVLTQTGAFAVNILAAQHGALASRFAGGNGVEGEARFEEGDWSAVKKNCSILPSK
jgi:flavin reductase (DIM6/NTAB) family NADH-FMN oxidoreductase RutF